METKNKQTKTGKLLPLKQIKFVGKNADTAYLVMQRQANFIVVFK